MNTDWLERLFRRREPEDDLSAPVLLNYEAELIASPCPRFDDAESVWWTTPYGRWRLTAEIEAMRRFPGFEPARTWDDAIQWTGWLTSELTSRRYRVQVSYPDEFPDDAPKVSILEPTLPEGVPHILSPQRPCLYGRGGAREGYDPGSTTAATLVAWTALWIHAFETWKWTGAWPGKGD